jgi:hypothetical protein
LENNRSRGCAARCSSYLPDLRTSTSRGRARQLSCGHRGFEGRDHRIVAQAPGRDGLIPNRRAPASGTAARATTELGSSPNPATTTGARSTRARGLPPRPGQKATRSGAGCRERRAQAEDPMIKSTPWAWRQDRPALIVARCGSTPWRGRFTFHSHRSWPVDRREITLCALGRAIAAISDRSQGADPRRSSAGAHRGAFLIARTALRPALGGRECRSYNLTTG